MHQDFVFSLCIKCEPGVWDVLTAPNAAHTLQDNLSVIVEEEDEKEKERQGGGGEIRTVKSHSGVDRDVALGPRSGRPHKAAGGAGCQTGRAQTQGLSEKHLKDCRGSQRDQPSLF